MKESDAHVIEEIVENMASKLYFHGHPINRQEAKHDLKLKVNLDLSPELEAALWDLYKEYEGEFENQSVFDPAGDLAGMSPSPQPPHREYTLVHAMVESVRLSSQHTTRRRFTMVPLPQPGQQAVREDILSQGWRHSQVP